MTRSTIPPDLKDRVAALERNAPQVPPAVHHLFALLPEPGAAFPASLRVQFLQALTCIFHMTYGGSDPLKIEAVQHKAEPDPKP